MHGYYYVYVYYRLGDSRLDIILLCWARIWNEHAQDVCVENVDI